MVSSKSFHDRRPGFRLTDLTCLAILQLMQVSDTHLRPDRTERLISFISDNPTPVHEEQIRQVIAFEATDPDVDVFLAWPIDSETYFKEPVQMGLH